MTKALRIIIYKKQFSNEYNISFFDGDIEKDRKYWEKQQIKVIYGKFEEL